MSIALGVMSERERLRLSKIRGFASRVGAAEFYHKCVCMNIFVVLRILYVC